MPRVHPDHGKEDKSRRARLKSKSSESKDESSESEESLYNSWKNKLKRLKRNKREKLKVKDDTNEKESYGANSKKILSLQKSKPWKKHEDDGSVDWESKTPFVFTFVAGSFPPIAEAEEVHFADDVSGRKLLLLFHCYNTCKYINNFPITLPNIILQQFCLMLEKTFRR